jgi:hypothetical protein
MAAKRACAGGTVRVLLKSGKRTVSRRVAKLNSRCAFSTSVITGKRGKLSISVRFNGSSLLKARTAKTISVRAG